MKKGSKVKQRDITDCGAACLASVCAHHKLRIPVSRIRQYAGTDQRGTNIAGILEAASQLGFDARGAKGSIEQLANIPLPAIAHVIQKNQLQHFVVIYKTRKGGIVYMDPADGMLHRKNLNAFKLEWTGILVLMLPAISFKAGNHTHSKLVRFLQLLRPHSSMVLQSIIGAIVATILGLAMSVYVQKIVDNVLVEGNTKLLNMMSVVMLFIFVVQHFIGYIKSMIALTCGQYIDAGLILNYYKHLLHLPQRFFDTMRVGEIISRVNDAVKIRVFVNDVAVSLFVNTCSILFVVAVMFVYYWKLALISLLLIPLQVIVYWISNRINKRMQRALMERAADLETQLVESINAAGTIKRFGLEEYAGFKTETKFFRLLETVYVAGKRSLQLSSISDFFNKVLTIGLLWAGSYSVISRELSPGELLSFYALLGYLTAPVSGFIAANKSVQDALIAMDRLYEIIDLETEIENEQQITLSREGITDIHFSNVHFRYGTRAFVFKGLNLVIKKGQMNALVGESGSGKSTLLSLMQNLYPLPEGNITMGDIDLSYYSKASLRKLISVVPQQIELFAGTIIENVAIGQTEPDVKRVILLCHALGLHDFIEKLPETYYTYLSEQGVNLSGGQRQRIAIARALYRQPEILILDEATASLDPVSEGHVQQVLQQYKQAGKTIIVIAHRLSTVRHAECINVLHEGKLMESGTHEELIQKQAYYYQLWQQYAIA